MKIKPIFVSFPDKRGTIVDSKGRVWIATLTGHGEEWVQYINLPEEPEEETAEEVEQTEPQE